MAFDELIAQWRDASPQEIAELIDEEYHQPLRRGLPQLHAMMKRAKVDEALLREFEQLREELEHHIGKEDQLLLPLLRSGVRPQQGSASMRFVAEHRAHRE